MAAPAPSREGIYRQLGVDKVPGDYVVLVDTSGSMAAGGRYSNVRSVLGGFLSGLAPSDYVALYTFDASPQRRYAGRAADRAAILNALPGGPTPNGKTDIGLGIEQALNELNRANAADIATVVLLTDGKQDAPASSAYRSTTAPAWTKLKTRAGSLKKTWLGAYALPLRAQTGASLLQKVIPGTVVLQPSTGRALAGYLDQSKQATRLAKARSLLAGDIAEGVRTKWTATQSDAAAGSATLRATITSQTRRVPLTVSNLRVAASDGVTWSGPPPATVTLQPGQARSFTYTAHWKPGFSLKLWPHQAAVSAPLSLTGQVSSPWAAALAPEIALNTPAKIANGGDVRLSKTTGSWSAAGLAAGILLLILLVLLMILYVRAFPTLPRGAIGVYEVGAVPGQGARRIDQFPVQGRRVQHDSRSADARFRVRGRRVPTTNFAPGHIGLAATLVRNDVRGSSSHTIRPAQGGLVGGLYLLHVPSGDEVPARLRMGENVVPSPAGSPWAESGTRDDDAPYAGRPGEERSVWDDDVEMASTPASDDTNA
jgi:hypothetical protein